MSRTQAVAATSQQECNHWQMMALLHDLAAGFFVGIVPGYATHLLADSLTPRAYRYFNGKPIQTLPCY